MGEERENVMSEQRTLLLVDDEENILRALTRLLRRDGYTILTASGGEEGLAQLEAHPVGVILSDQRMPGMIGSEFLGRAKALRPDTIRIMLSGYTDLQSVTDAINRGAIYKFLTKPWEDDLLRENIRQAFEQYELRAERDRLAEELREANTQLAAANIGLEQQVSSQEHDLELHHHLLELSREVLEHLPVGVLGIGEDSIIAVANSRAHTLLGQAPSTLLGSEGSTSLPERLYHICTRSDDTPVSERWRNDQGELLQVYCERLDKRTRCQGRVLVLVPKEGD